MTITLTRAAVGLLYMFFALSAPRLHLVASMSLSQDLPANDAAGVEALPPSTLPPAPANAIRQQRPRVVNINKCCQLNEHLDQTRRCVAGLTSLWAPDIYFIKKNAFHTPAGSVPQFMHFQPNTLPLLTTSGCTDASQLELITGKNRMRLLSNGSLYLREFNRLIGTPEYCVDSDVALVCLPSSHSGDGPKPRLKLRKCCGVLARYDVQTRNCARMPESVSEQDLDSKQLRLKNLNAEHYQTIYGFPFCRNASTRYAIAGDWHDARFDNISGRLQLPHKHLNVDDYCLEHLYVAGDSGRHLNDVKVIACSHHFGVDPDDDEADAENTAGWSDDGMGFAYSRRRYQRTTDFILTIALVVSLFFLAATIIAGFLLPTSSSTVMYWRCQNCYVCCLFVGYLLLAINKLFPLMLIGTGWCALSASIMHFFFLASFFWLNAMCFHIWWTFRDMRPSSLDSNQEKLRLRLYTAYAWGLPLLIAGIAFVVDQLPETHLIRPHFSEPNCWFNGAKLPIFTYFFGPVGVLLFVNMLLFILTTHQLTCGLWRRDDVKSTSDKTALRKVCLKLVVVMGITWILDIMSWLADSPKADWFVADLINAMQGVFIFSVFFCQPQVWAACKRFFWPVVRQEITNSTNGVHHSSSSQGGADVAFADTTHNSTILSTVASSPNKTIKIPMETVC